MQKNGDLVLADILAGTAAVQPPDKSFLYRKTYRVGVSSLHHSLDYGSRLLQIPHPAVTVVIRASGEYALRHFKALQVLQTYWRGLRTLRQFRHRRQVRQYR